MEKALEGVRVIACTQIHAGAWCSRQLAELGAEVIRIEHPRGSPTRNPYDLWAGLGALAYKGESFYDVHHNAQHKFITLNLKTEEGKKIFIELIKKSDIFVENLGPGSMDRLGLGYDVQSKINPKIIYASIKTYGLSGPCKDEAGGDYICQARSGLMTVNGHPGMPDTLIGVAVVDHFTATMTTVAILAALYYREKTGQGQLIDMSLFDCAVDLLAEQTAGYFVSRDPNCIAVSKRGNLGVWGENKVETIYETKDGKLFLQLGLGWGSKDKQEEYWTNLMTIIGRSDLINDPRYNAPTKRLERINEIRNILAEWLKTKTTMDAYTTLKKIGVLCTPLQTVPQMYDFDPQVKARKLFVEVEHPTLGKVKVARSPFNLSKTPGYVERPGMPVGYDNEEIYCSLLGYSKEKLKELREKGVI
ncbi:MAG: CaiB/BaiF CoA-transferase family protein [Nitrososphaeria archaeon]